MNEPEEAGHEYTAKRAAEYDNIAYKVCEADREKGYGCTIIAGNMQDGSGMEKYEEEYEKYLKPTPKIWGVHPYKTVEERKSNKAETRLQKFVEYLPSKGAGDELIITEVGAFYCKPSGEVVGEETQAKEAEYLTKDVMPWFAPLHVFYYEFDFKENKSPPCGGGEGEDVALFEPETATETGFRPRAAAAWVYSDKRSPWAFTIGLGGLGKRSAEMRGEVYPEGVSTEYWFEYGTTSSYGAGTGKVGVGSGSGLQWAYGAVEGLTPGTTYHYRLVAHSAEGTSYGVDRSFTTEAAPPLVGGQTVNVTTTSADLAAQIDPEGLQTKYHFEYGREAGKYTVSTSEGVVKETGLGWESVYSEVSGLEVCQTYHFRVVATNEDGTTDEPDREFKTECLPPEAATGGVSELQARSAVVAGTVNPEGQATSFEFEYGLSDGYGLLAPVPAGSAGEGRASAPVNATLAGLKQHTVYHYRLSATNATGTVRGSDETLETPYAAPRVCGEKATEVRPESAVLEAEVNPEENATTYAFEYGPSAAYGTRLPLLGNEVGSGTSCVKVSDAIVALTPGETYHFRVVAENGGKTTPVYGTDMTFTPPVEWLVGGKGVSGSAEVEGLGYLQIGAPTVNAKMNCGMGVLGAVDAGVDGELSRFAGSGGSKLIGCELVKDGSCVSAASVEATGLPWKVEVGNEPVKNTAGEVVRYETTYRIVKGSGGTPGWVVRCEAAGGVKDEVSCSGVLSGVARNAGSFMQSEFEEAGGETSCSGGGRLGFEGAIGFGAKSKESLNIAGARVTALPPVVHTAEPSGVTETAATLNGLVLAEGEATSYWFEYGPTKSYGTRVPASPASIEGLDVLGKEVAEKITGLTPASVYHYRLVAENAAGRTYGEDESFEAGPPAEWRVGGKGVSGSVAVEALGYLQISAPTVNAKMNCGMGVLGTVDAGVDGELSRFAGSGGSKLIGCELVKDGSCVSAASVEATGLPWKVEVGDEPVKNAAGETVRYETTYRIVKGSGGTPGWVVRCEAAGGVKDEVSCSGVLSGVARNAGSFMQAEFEEGGGETSCSGGGRLGFEGAIGFGAKSKESLNVAGARATALPPVVHTAEPSGVTEIAATLNGLVLAEGEATSYWFEYGPTKSYGTRVPASPASIEGLYVLGKEVAEKITGLTPASVYHYRLVAENAAGRTYGEEQTFEAGAPAEWLVGGKGVSGSAEVEGLGYLQISAPAVNAKMNCGMGVLGAVDAGVDGELSRFAGSGGSKLIGCELIKDGSCVSGASVEASGLPWKVEVGDEPVKNTAGETVRYETTYRIVKGSGSIPGWVVRCEAAGGVKDEVSCSGVLSGVARNAGSFMQAEFEEGGGETSCSGGGRLSVQGAIGYGAKSKESLNIAGARATALPPVVHTTEPSGVTETAATLNGLVLAEGEATSYWFEYGPTKSYGTRVPASPASIEGLDVLGKEVAEKITGLTPASVYHYRLVAENAAGRTYGEEQTFEAGSSAEWLVGGRKVSGSAAVEALGYLQFGVPTVNAKLDCDMGVLGSVDTGVDGELSRVAGSGGSKLVACELVKDGSCVGSASVEASGLPWNIEIGDEPIKNTAGEIVRYETTYRIMKGAGGTPGWVVRCEAAGGVKDEVSCSGVLSGVARNAGGFMQSEFEEGGGETACSGGGRLAVDGAIGFGATSKESLNIAGARADGLPPVVHTTEASNMTQTSARLNGLVLAQGEATSYWFEYGPTRSYGTQIPATPAPIEGLTVVGQEVSKTITGLTPRKLYHYRLVAENSSGRSYGQDQTLGAETPPGWLANGLPADALPASVQGTLSIHETGLGITAECAINGSAQLDSSTGNIETLTTENGGSTIDCHSLASGWCASATIQLTPGHMPLASELISLPIENQAGEGNYEARLSLGENNGPDWQIKCSFMGSTITDTCLGRSTGKLENTPTGALVDLEEKTPYLTCSGSTLGTATIQGTLTIKSTQTGQTLSIYGAPEET